jgi:DNA-binding NarL/FixJ family response regulator
MKILLIGERNKLNSTVVDILSTQPGFSVESCPPSQFPGKLTNGPGKDLDILIADLTAFDTKPVETIVDIKKLGLNCSLLAVHVYTSTHFIKPLLKAGAQGYLPSATTKKEMMKAIEKLSQGDNYPPF